MTSDGVDRFCILITAFNGLVAQVIKAFRFAHWAAYPLSRMSPVGLHDVDAEMDRRNRPIHRREFRGWGPCRGVAGDDGGRSSSPLALGKLSLCQGRSLAGEERRLHSSGLVEKVCVRRCEREKVG